MLKFEIALKRPESPQLIFLAVGCEPCDRDLDEVEGLPEILLLCVIKRKLLLLKWRIGLWLFTLQGHSSVLRGYALGEAALT